MSTTTEYLNAEDSIAAYELHYGRPLSANAAALIRKFVPLINQAYVNGYNAALEDIAHD